ncbi:MAG: carboxypeptidase-like regulatory domain-containing protein [Terriglobales bacterium]
MKRRSKASAVSALIPVALVLMLWVGLASQQTRTVQGVVLDAKDNALPGAIVYLKNSRSRAERTYIVGDDGKFSFHGLAPNTDYDLYSQYQGKKSSTRTVSSFDSRAEIVLDLKVPIQIAGK